MPLVEIIPGSKTEQQVTDLAINLVKEVRESVGEERPPIRGRLEIFMRICEAVAYAHSRRVLHLDIKPSNIQIGEFGEVQVCDWGLGVVMPDEDATGISTALLDPDLYGPLLLSLIHI